MVPLSVPQINGQDILVTGWFRRGRSQSVSLQHLETGDKRVSGFVKTGGLIGGGLLVTAGATVAALM